MATKPPERKMALYHPLKLRAHLQKKFAARRTRWVGLLPDEMWILIIQHTPDSTLAALNRTCHAMSEECTRELRRRKEAKLQFLRDAESSCPTMVVCASCVMFHARPSKRVNDMKNLYWEIAPTFSSFDLGGPKCRQNAQRVRLAKQDELDWWRVHLAMRSHRFSAVHGPPVSDLNKITIRLRGLWTSSTEAVVHDDHLLLKVQGFRLLSKGEDYTRHMPCCKHLKTSQAMLAELRRWHDRFFRERSAAGPDLLPPPVVPASPANANPPAAPPLVPGTTATATSAPSTAPTTSSMLYRCSVCPFEFRLSIGTGGTFTSEAAEIVWRNRDLRHERRADNFMLCITSYVDLGKCADPGEAEWSALAGEGVRVPVGYEKFHRPTIESRFEHHASLSPLNFEEIAIAVGTLTV